jgi:methionyl-tRNA synthetase
MAKFYVTTTIYYVNDVPHLGHAYTTLAADVVARYWREKLGRDRVFFLTGTDEHGQKIQQAAEAGGLEPRAFADKVAPRFEEAWKLLNIDYDFFIRTTDPRHERVVTKILEKAYQRGFIYKGIYKGLYCVGCEKFLTETDIVDGKCPLHPNKQPEYQEEENYFLKLSELSKEVLRRIEAGEYEILPQKRHNEIVSRLRQGVEDISVSRAGVSWGIPLPWDKSQTVYVWVDALINYYSATQFLEGKQRFWPADLHLIGKDIIWFHTVIWQALLVAAGIELPRAIFAHGFFTIDGQKISKSLGNVIAPKQLVDKYGVDGTRYLVLSAYPFGEDGDISFDRLDTKYNADLANGLGNLVARVSKLAEGSRFTIQDLRFTNNEFVENYKFDEALKVIWGWIATIDKEVNEKKPWTLKGQELETTLEPWINEIRKIGIALQPFLPETAVKILNQFAGPKVHSAAPLFPRL